MRDQQYTYTTEVLTRHAESWTEVETAPRYAISSLGRVRGPRGRLLACPPDSRGYRRFNVYRGVRGTETLHIHRLVCKAFNGPPPFEGALVRHLDGNPRNNHFANLAWGTHADNREDARRHGTLIRGERAHTSKLTEALVRRYRAEHAAGRVGAVQVAAEAGVCVRTARLMLSGRTWSHVL